MITNSKFYKTLKTKYRANANKIHITSEIVDVGHLYIKLQGLNFELSASVSDG